MFAEGIRSNAVLPHQDVALHDQIAAEAFELNLEENELDEMEETIEELVAVSTR